MSYDWSVFQKNAICNDEWQINDNNYYKKTVPLFLFFEGQIHQYSSAYFILYATYSLIATIHV